MNEEVYAKARATLLNCVFKYKMTYEQVKKIIEDKYKIDYEELAQMVDTEEY